jgi:hypothetical protein
MSNISSLLSNRSTHIHDRFIRADVVTTGFDAYSWQFMAMQTQKKSIQREHIRKISKNK